MNPLAADPAAYGNLLALAKHIGGSPLDQAVRELVELRASQINGCAFCLDLHAKRVRRHGIPEEKIDVLAGWRESPNFTPPERAALGLTEEMIRIGDGRRVAASTWEAAAASFTEEQLAALLFTIGLIQFWNVLNVTVEMPPNSELPPGDRRSN